MSRDSLPGLLRFSSSEESGYLFLKLHRRSDHLKSPTLFRNVGVDATLPRCLAPGVILRYMSHQVQRGFFPQGTAQFGAFTSALRVHLVEVSPALRDLQREKLQCQEAEPGSTPSGRDTEPGPSVSGISGVPVTWHSSLEDVPRGLMIAIGHEFLDAVPVHQFQVRLSWKEMGLDVSFPCGLILKRAPILRRLYALRFVVYSFLRCLSSGKLGQIHSFWLDRLL